MKRKFIKTFITRIFDDEVTILASSLSYTTILSLVPIIAILLSALAILPIFSEYNEHLENFIMYSIVPQYSKIITDNLRNFVSNASQTTFIGTIFVVFISILLVRKIDIILNKICHCDEKRTLGKTIFIYFAFYFLSPITIIFLFATISTILSLDIIKDANVYIIDKFAINFLSIIPYCIFFGLLFSLYYFIPNYKVKIKYACNGSCFAIFLLIANKNLFSFFIDNFTTYSFVYGAFAMVPIFMLWIFINWFIVLTGMLFAYTLDDMNNNKINY